MVSKALGDLQEQRLQAFVAAPGFTLQPDDRLETQLPDAACTHCPADRGLHMLTWPMMRIDAVEGYLPHARYLAKVWYVPVHDPDGDDSVTLTLVELSRFNHGARISRELRRDYGEHARDALPTDTMPHVQWRFALMPIPQTNGFTQVVAPSRRVLGDRDAARSGCLGSDCVALAYDSQGEPRPPLPGGAWQSHVPAMTVVPTPAPFEGHRRQQAGADGQVGVMDIDAISEALQEVAGVGVDGEAMDATRKQPDVVMQIDHLLDGQDAMTVGMLCWLDMADDAIRHDCTRVTAIGDMPPQWDRYQVKHSRGN